MLNPISDKEYTLLRDLIYKESGISMARLKREIILSRVSKRLRERKLERFLDYYELVICNEDELSELINCVSTNVTQFFREPKQFEYLSASIIPELASSGAGRIRAWSAGCSTGEEPYSIAITVSEALEKCSAGGVDVMILASDLSTRVIRKAEEGIYKGEDLASLHDFVVQKHFLSGVGKNRGLFKIKQHIMDKVIFRRINLTGSTYPIRGAFDIIFCRNVIIYFDRPTQDRVIRALLRFLKPGGYLFCGHSESLIGVRNTLRAVQPCIYRKDP